LFCNVFQSFHHVLHSITVAAASLTATLHSTKFQYLLAILRITDCYHISKRLFRDSLGLCEQICTVRIHERTARIIVPAAYIVKFVYVSNNPGTDWLMFAIWFAPTVVDLQLDFAHACR
jgi:hypothetical protein